MPGRRTRRFGFGLAAASLLAILLLTAASASPAEARKHPRFGVNTSAVGADFADAPRPRKAARKARGMGARFARLGISWNWVQRRAGAQMRWEKYDKEVHALHRVGIRPVMMIHGSPEWARPRTRCSNKHCPPDSEHFDEWAAFAGAVARRYRDNGLAAIEVWNSANTQPWWPIPGGPDPAHYARVYSWAANAIHKRAPRIPVLFCSCGGNRFEDTRTELSLPTFLRGFYSNVNRKVLLPRDALSIHAYPSKRDLRTDLQSRFLKVLGQARQVRNAVDPAHAERKIWLTEVGMTTSGPDGFRVNPRQQARGVVAAMKKVWWMGDIGAALIFTLVETKWNTQHPEEHGFGVMRRGDGSSLIPKPAYCRLAAWSPRPPRRPPGC